MGAEPVEELDLLVDIYTPVGAPMGRPALLFIHGGPFTGGSRKDPRIVATAEYFTIRRWVCASIDYRLAGDRGTVPEEWIEEAGASITRSSCRSVQRHEMRRLRFAWLHDSAGRLGVRDGAVAVLGGSAGANLALMLGVTEPADYCDELTVAEDQTLAKTNLDALASVEAIVDFWGSPGLVELRQTIYDQNRWDAGDPPLLIVHGTEDDVVPFSQAENLRDHYEAAGAPVEFVTLKCWGHAAWAAEVDGKGLPELAFDFLVEAMDLDVVE